MNLLSKTCFVMYERRIFIKRTVLSAGALVSASALSACTPVDPPKTSRVEFPLKLSFTSYELQLKHVFTLAGSSRTTTPVVLTQLECGGITGFGEASLPPYLGETQESVSRFLAGLDLAQFRNPFLMEDILDYVFNSAPGNYAAKASVDIALHDLTGKIAGQPWFRILGLNPDVAPMTSFTIGIDTPEMVKEKVREAGAFKILKVKLGRGNDQQMIESVREVTSLPLCVDVNQGWTDRKQALEMVYWLKEQGVIFVEQPFAVSSIDDHAWLTQHSPLPVIADEALQTLDDVLPLHGVYSGINIKLMKCGGMRAAMKMITIAKVLGMKVMIGCMTETSCAVTAAAQLSPLAEWADLDGNLLISNDVYDGIRIIDGKVKLPERPGIGISRLPD
jgi:L-Ala-D/L-Glu epimerase